MCSVGRQKKRKGKARKKFMGDSFQNRHLQRGNKPRELKGIVKRAESLIWNRSLCGRKVAAKTQNNNSQAHNNLGAAKLGFFIPSPKASLFKESFLRCLSHRKKAIRFRPRPQARRWHEIKFRGEDSGSDFDPFSLPLKSS